MSNHYFSPGEVTGQFTPAPPTCPGDAFTFTCTVTGDMNGFTIWRVGGTNILPLHHRSDHTSSYEGFIATPGAGFGQGTSATSFTSTLSGTANPELKLNGTLVECFGPTNNEMLSNRVGNGTIQIKGQCVFVYLGAVGMCIIQSVGPFLLN